MGAVIVVDASVAVHALVRWEGFVLQLAEDQVAAPHLIDGEVAHAVRGLVLGGKLDVETGRAALVRWGVLGLQRYAATPLLPRIWELRHNLSACDATYVALAEAFDCNLVTADARIAATPGARCPVTVLRT